MTEIFTDKSLMPIGTYKGEAMINVPAWYLVRIYDMQYTWVPGEVRSYIKSNYSVLQYQIKQSKR